MEINHEGRRLVYEALAKLKSEHNRQTKLRRQEYEKERDRLEAMLENGFVARTEL